MTTTKEEPRELTDDGVSEEFYHLLWTKDELNFAPAVNLPDTIFFKYGQPHEWYFTSTNGKVKKKNKGNIMNAKIEEVFNKNILGYDVIAVFYGISLERDLATGEFPVAICEYLDRDGLSNFLYKRKANKHGILQRFVEPKGTKTETIRAIWSPKVFLLERAENVHDLHDPRFGLYERCVTYEGPEYFYKSTPLRGPVLAGQIQKICESIVSHFTEVSFGQKVVSRMVLSFRVDSRDKIWLLYSTSIRCIDMMEIGSATEKQERQLLNIASNINLPITVNLNPKVSHEKIVPLKRIRCLSCGKETLENMRYPVPYKNIVKHYEHVLHIAKEICGKNGNTVLNWPPDEEVIHITGGVGFGCLGMSGEPGTGGDDVSSFKGYTYDLNKPLDVAELEIPPIIRYLHPRMNAKSYRRCHKDPLFIYKTVLICEPCYLVYAEFSTMLLRLGQDLKRLLNPDASAVGTASFDENTLTMGSSLTRPSSAEWRSISRFQQSASEGSLRNGSAAGKLNPSHNHLRAKQHAIGLRSQDARSQPELPGTVRHDDDATAYRSKVSFDPNRTGGDLNTQSFVSSIYDASDVQSLIKEREQQFFTEISRNPRLSDQHPLTHLVASHQKLQLADKQSGIHTTKASSQQESVFGTRFGKQGGDQFDRYGAYSQEIPYIIDSKLVLPSKFKKQKQLERLKIEEKKRERRERKKQAMELDQMSVVSSEPSISIANSLPDTSVKHMAFLNESLHRVRKALEKPPVAMGPIGGDGDGSPLRGDGFSQEEGAQLGGLEELSRLTAESNINFSASGGRPSTSATGARPSTTASTRGAGSSQRGRK